MGNLKCRHRGAEVRRWRKGVGVLWARDTSPVRLRIQRGTPLDRHGTEVNDMANILALQELAEETALDAPFSSYSLFNC
ncbi:hypothetical protein GA0115254_111812 [Streptomyces sp. Ncost-T10-10d]|nr:hypothetical protein GA0115254_111812 [Streptomyces sp. Ncost-T10-10d]